MSTHLSTRAPGTHVALYCRLSPRPDGRSEGVDVQERQGRRYAAQAWPGVPVVVYADRLLSAADEDVWRPEYEKLRQAIRDGQVAHLWAVEQSRLQRLEVGWFVLAAELVAAGIDEVHTNRDGIVRVADDIAGIKAVLAAGEVRKMKKRVNDRLAENARDGLAAGSLPFGFRHALDARGGKTYEQVPEQAEAIRWAADKVLLGWSLASIAAALRERGLTGPHRVKVRDSRGEILTDLFGMRDSRTGHVVTDGLGKPVTRPTALTPGSVRSMLTKPTIAGWRVHSGRTVGRGNWEPILDEATWQACRAKLSAPRTVERSDGGTYQVSERHSGYSGRKYLMTGGLIVCGVCGHPMVGTLKQLKRRSGREWSGQSRAYYLCHPSRGGRACTGIMLAETEQHVLDRLWAELDKPGFLDAIAEDAHAARRDEITIALSAIDGQRRELAALWAKGKDQGGLTSDEWQAARAGLSQAERELRAELTEKGPPPARVDIAEARSSWPHMNLGEQREFIRLFIDRVAVSRAVPGTQGFDAARVMIKWRLG